MHVLFYMTLAKFSTTRNVERPLFCQLIELLVKIPKFTWHFVRISPSYPFKWEWSYNVPASYMMQTRDLSFLLTSLLVILLIKPMLRKCEWR